MVKLSGVQADAYHWRLDSGKFLATFRISGDQIYTYQFRELPCLRLKKNLSTVVLENYIYIYQIRLALG